MSNIAQLSDNPEEESLTRLSIMIRNGSPQYTGDESPETVAREVLSEELENLTEELSDAEELQDGVRERLGLDDDTDASAELQDGSQSEAEAKQEEIRKRITGGN